ncbi:hypothetical protein AAFF_G00415150 [Aldrovandia affinis]|uniref:Uncharacterized protein n=1 Tax=Aldrovandia affinis TaxID=143900 RepID=A0AAD7SAR0_9TELE|nr:hypothetical protein AAFF_G00415150 [Aldrovandia affinis]
MECATGGVGSLLAPEDSAVGLLKCSVPSCLQRWVLFTASDDEPRVMESPSEEAVCEGALPAPGTDPGHCISALAAGRSGSRRSAGLRRQGRGPGGKGGGDPDCITSCFSLIEVSRLPTSKVKPEGRQVCLAEETIPPVYAK